jgi:predicted amidophosphoribosyltransferase
VVAHHGSNLPDGVLVPITCPGCGARGAPLCRACAASMRPPPALPPPAGLDHCAAVFAYEGPARELVARLKYRNHRSTLAGLAAAMAASVPSTPDTVTWAPTTPERRRRRGFDHAELLARAVARHLGRPCTALLERGAGPAQTGRPLAERRIGPLLIARTAVTGHVLVVDDVITSGATCTAAARVLREAGATTISAIAAARTPPPSGRGAA